MGTFFTGIAAGIYIMGVLIVAFMKGMGGDDRAPSALLWPITFIMSWLTFIMSYWKKQ